MAEPEAEQVAPITGVGVLHRLAGRVGAMHQGLFMITGRWRRMERRKRTSTGMASGAGTMADGDLGRGCYAGRLCARRGCAPGDLHS
jgi:hypothetical protein